MRALVDSNSHQLDDIYMDYIQMIPDQYYNYLDDDGDVKMSKCRNNNTKRKTISKPEMKQQLKLANSRNQKYAIQISALKQQVTLANEKIEHLDNCVKELTMINDKYVDLLNNLS